jgi:hypothetical protein
MLSITLASGACTGDDDEEPSTDPTPGRTAAVEVPIVVRPGVLAGTLAPRARRAVAAEVGKVVDAWFEAAYLGGDYPRRDFSDAFHGFTHGAARLARRDRAQMSNATIGARVDEVVPVRRTVRVDLLSPRRRAVGATARFRLEFTTAGDLARRVVVNGRLALTRTKAGAWRVFAYDVRRGTRPLPDQGGTEEQR